MDIPALSTSKMLGASMFSAWRTACSSPTWDGPCLCGFYRAIWQHVHKSLCCNFAAEWRSAKSEVIENEAGTELQGVAEPVIWKMKHPNASSRSGVSFGWCNASHLLPHWGDAVTPMGPSRKKYRNPQKSIGWNGTVTPRNIPGKEMKMMVCFGWQIFLPAPREALEYLRWFKCWAEALNVS